MVTNYLVTGGAGFIGSHIATALVERGHRVSIFDNFSTGRSENLRHLHGQVEVIEGDLLDRRALEHAIQDVEVIFHEAALASVPRSVADPLATHQACATGTLNVLDLARLAGVRRVVYAASSSAYGNQPYSAKRESDLPRPLSPYAVAKLSGEYYCQAFTASYELEAVGIRYFNVFGPRQDPNSEYSAVIPIFITKMLRGESPTIFGNGLQSRDFTFIDNVVSANLSAATAEGADGTVMNVACGRQFSLLDLVATINGLLGTHIEPVFEVERTGDVKESLADISLARQVLGYEPVIDFEEGLKRSVDYYRTLQGGCSPGRPPVGNTPRGNSV